MQTKDDEWWERFARWPLHRRLELLAFETVLAGFPSAYVEALWQAIRELR